jgi:hypothetical protein
VPISTTPMMKKSVIITVALFARNPADAAPARGASNMRITAMMGIGLIATPAASGSTSPMTLLIPTPVAAPIGYLKIDNGGD